MDLYCPHCDGTGECPCVICDGEGCDSCPGRCGRVECATCGGEGLVEEEPDVEDFYAQRYRKEIDRLNHSEQDELKRAQHEHDIQVSINLGDMPLPTAIAALYNAASAFNAGFLDPNHEHVATAADAAFWLKNENERSSDYVFLDYVNGRFLKLHIVSENHIDTRRYDEVYGAGTAEHMLSLARIDGPAAPKILAHHLQVSSRNREGAM